MKLNESQYIDTYKTLGIIAMENAAAQSKVDWAMRMLESGLETESLAILATLEKFVNEFEADDYFGRVFKELEIEIPDRKSAILGYAKAIALEVIQGITAPTAGASLLYKAYVKLEHTKELGEYSVLNDFRYCKEVNGWSDEELSKEITKACKQTYDVLVYPELRNA